MKTKYFVRKDPDGTPASVYKSEWALGVLVSEDYWDTETGSWKRTKAISYWNHFGDTEVEEVSEQAALALI